MTEAARKTLREAVLEAIADEMQRDPSVVVLGQDVGAFGGPLRSTAGLAERFGDDRVVDMPICEASMTGMAVGAGLQGLRPIVEIMFGDMLTVAATELLQQAANVHYMSDGKASAPLVVRTRAGDGPYRAHPQHLEAMFASMPGLVVVNPSNPADAAGLMRAAIRSDDPVLFIESLFLYNGPRGLVPQDEHVVEIGRAAVARPGTDVTVVTYGRPVLTALEAARRLESRGMDVEIVDLRTIRPLDREAVVASVRKTGRLVVAHEAWVSHGVGAEVIAVAMEGLEGSRTLPVRRVGAPDIPIPYAKQLRDLTLVSVDRIEEAVLAVMPTGQGDA